MFNDSHGGAYLRADRHFWYITAERAERVLPVERDQIGPGDHQITPATTSWFLTFQWQDKHFTQGYEDGYEAGYQDGLSEAPDVRDEE